MRRTFLACFGLAALFSSASAKAADSEIQPLIYILPQVVSGTFPGGSFRTTFVIFNNSSSAPDVTISLTDNSGLPMPLTITGLGTSSKFSLRLPAGATQILQSDGGGTLMTGAARVVANARISVSALFSLYDASGGLLTESGVGSSDPLRDFILPVDTTGSFNTGVALFNPGNGNALLTLTLSDTTGSEIARKPLVLNNNEHISRFVAGSSELFPEAGPLRGTLTVSSSVPIVGLALRQHEAPLSYTSLPVVSRATHRMAFYFPHAANGLFAGGSYRTTFVLLNLSDGAAGLKLELTQDNGSPLTLTIPEAGTASTFVFRLEARESLFLQSDGSGTLSSGAAMVSSDSPVAAAAIFSLYDSAGRFQTEAGVYDSPVQTALTLPVDVAGSYDTGIAFFNPSPSESTLLLQLYDPLGRPSAQSQSLRLAPGGHAAKFVSQIFEGLGTFRGALAISAVTTGVAALTLRQNSIPLSYTTLPVAPGTVASKGSYLEKTRTDLELTVPIRIDETLQPALRLSGRVSGSGTPTSVFAQSGDGRIFRGTLNNVTRYYLIPVPAGVYSLILFYQPSKGCITGPYVEPVEIQVSADTVFDVTLPGPIASFDVAGQLRHFPVSSTDSFVNFVSSDGLTLCRFHMVSDKDYEGTLPSGSYTAGVTVYGSTFFGVKPVFSFYGAGVVSGTSTPVTANLNAPPTARLSGKVSGLYTSSRLFAVNPHLWLNDTSIPAFDPFGSVKQIDPTTTFITVFGDYSEWVTDGRTYDVQGTFSLPWGGPLPAEFSLQFLFPALAKSVKVDGGAVLSFSIPSELDKLLQTDFFDLDGIVTDQTGTPITDVSVAVYTDSLEGVPDIAFSVSAKNDSTGRYSKPVLRGKRYRIRFSPPLPEP